MLAIRPAKLHPQGRGPKVVQQLLRKPSVRFGPNSQMLVICWPTLFKALPNLTKPDQCRPHVNRGWTKADSHRPMLVEIGRCVTDKGEQN